MNSIARRRNPSSSFLLCPVLLGVVLFSEEAVLAQPVTDDQKERIAALIRQLRDGSYQRREAAGQGLKAIGEAALPALRATVTDPSPEVRRRAREIVRSILLAGRKSKSTGMRLELIDSGGFRMGGTSYESIRRDDEFPQHRVRITRPILLGKYEVTQEEFQKVMKHNPSWFQEKGGGKDKVAGKDTRRFPVEQVSWYDAIEFCNRLSELDGFPPYYKLTDAKRTGNSITHAEVAVLGSSGYRLPTEAEWEYACRATTVTPYHFGHRNVGPNANTKPGPPPAYGSEADWEALHRTTAVGSYAANHFGLHDMHGNVAEWCGDWYHRQYYERSPEDDPSGPDQGFQRVLRGGSWLLTEGSCRSASRNYRAPDEAKYDVGIRVCRCP